MLPRIWWTFVLKMMAKKPDQRYQSMGEIAQVLTDWLVAQGPCG